jgi:hypothetical protein
MGDVQGVMPAPNVYLMSSNRPPEQVGFELLEDMHDPTKHQGAYTDFPSAITETERSPQYFRRLLLGGFDGAFAFNAVGMIQEGYRNTVVPTGRELGDFFDFSLQGLRTAFLRPKTGYFHNVIDYGGPISASGGMRESFRRFRRDALFFSSAQTAWGGAGHALRGGTLAGASPALRVDDLELGVPQGQDKVHYWLEGQGGERFLGIHNSTGSPRRVGSGEIELAGQQIPRFSSFEIPAEDGVDKSYTQILTTQLPLAPDVRLGYSTSELLTRRSWNGDRLAVFYGTEGGEGELSLEAAGLLQVEHLDQGLRAVETGARLTVTYRHSADYQHLVVRAPGGEILRIILTTREAAGRFWFLRGPGGEHIVLAGPDYLRPGTAWGAHDVEVLIEGGSRPIPLLVMTPRAADLASASPSTTWDPSTLAAVYPPLAAPALPAVPTLVDTGLGASDAAEADPSFDDSAWQQWTGDPQPLETLGIYSGHAWYRAEVNLPGLAPWNRGRLFVKGASDIVGVYVNGHYVSTVCPLGTEIDSHGGSSYRFTDLKRHLRVGRNVIAFRVEVWGHGAFHWPRGNLVATQARMPALGYDSLKGLVGEATLAGVKLETWSVRPELGGERAGFGGPGFSDSAWLPSQVPLALGKGEVRWHRARFRTADLPDPALINAPVVCEIVGRDCKATLFLNGRLIGRWLSDDTWLARGAWGRATRSMWIAVPADHFPIPRELLVPGGENVLSVAFEDASGPAGPGGRVDSLSLRLNAEGPRTWSRAPITHRRARLRVVWR